MLGLNDGQAKEFAEEALECGKKFRECDYSKISALRRWDFTKGEFAYRYKDCCLVISDEGKAIALYEYSRKPDRAQKSNRKKHLRMNRNEKHGMYDLDELMYG